MEKVSVEFDDLDFWYWTDIELRQGRGDLFVVQTEDK